VADVERLPLATKVAYGAPAFAGAAMAITGAVHMPRFYSDVVLAPLGYVALMIAVGRAFDAITDPMMGWLSDRTHTRWGRRRPYIALGTVPAAVCFWLLLHPPQVDAGSTAALWFGLSFLALFLFSTIISIPRAALGAELSPHYHERSSLFGIQSIFAAAGTIAGAILPGILQDGFGVSDERVVFGTVASVYALAMVVLNFVMLAKVRERREFMDRPSNPFIPGVRRALRNRPFRVLLLAGVVNAIPASIPAILIPYYTYYAIRPENPASWLAGFLLLYLGAGMLCLPLWMALARRIGKLATMAAASAMGISGSVLFFFVGEGDTSFASCVYGYTGIASGAFLFLIPSMGADTIDYDELRTGRRREAQFGAFWAIIPKFVSIPGASIPIAILSAVGYVPNEVQTPEVVFTIKFLYSLFPATFYVVALAIVLRYPISEAAHAAIRDGIDRHQRGETAVDPFTGERLPAPRTVTAEDEDTGWFLDYFSRGELERVLARGSGRLQFDVWRAFGASVVVLVGALLMAARSVSGLDSEPGPVAVLAVVLGGGALTSALFQAGRIGAASRFVARPVPTPVVQGHVDRLRPGGARA
jgi:GPH family glycoside/pentoside/hexuronide:cation symporter